jgi:predicted O-methyltransferase YrrM
MSENLNEFIRKIQNLPIKVGSITPPQQKFLIDFLAEHKQIKNILETGFHVGLSAAVMMDTRPDILVTSFDIFWFDYTRKAKLYLDIYYPGRNILLAGNSISSIPTYFKLNPGYMPDFVFIDGGHERPIPYLDMYILFKNIKEDTWIMIDDYCEAHGSQGVVEAVDVFIVLGIIKNIKKYNAADRGWVFCQRSSVSLPFSEYAENSQVIMNQLKDTESHYP